jgi:hypothetical protein
VAAEVDAAFFGARTEHETMRLALENIARGRNHGSFGKKRSKRTSGGLAGHLGYGGPVTGYVRT